MAKKENSTPIYKFNNNCSIQQDSLNYIVKEGVNFSYFPSLESALYYVYEQSIKNKLSEEQCKTIQEIADKVHECNHNLRLFINQNVSKK